MNRWQRQIITTLTGLLLLLFAYAVANADALVTQVKTGKYGASLRSYPEVTDSNKIAGIHANTVLDVYGQENGWYYVCYRGEYGYPLFEKYETLSKIGFTSIYLTITEIVLCVISRCIWPNQQTELMWEFMPPEMVGGIDDT